MTGNPLLTDLTAAGRFHGAHAPRCGFNRPPPMILLQIIVFFCSTVRQFFALGAGGNLSLSPAVLFFAPVWLCLAERWALKSRNDPAA